MYAKLNKKDLFTLSIKNIDHKFFCQYSPWSLPKWAPYKCIPLPPNISLGCVDLPGTNAPAYLKNVFKY
jgi:hypothetical protein